MDIQTRKLRAIEYLIGLHDEKGLRKIESTIDEIQKLHAIRNNLKPISQEQLIVRAKRSSSDYDLGKFKTQEQIEQESENW
jgi:hypothetical protein